MLVLVVLLLLVMVLMLDTTQFGSRVLLPTSAGRPKRFVLADQIGAGHEGNISHSREIEPQDCRSTYTLGQKYHLGAV